MLDRKLRYRRTVLKEVGLYQIHIFSDSFPSPLPVHFQSASSPFPFLKISWRVSSFDFPKLLYYLIHSAFCSILRGFKYMLRENKRMWFGMRYLLGAIQRLWIPPAKFDIFKDVKKQTKNCLSSTKPSTSWSYNSWSSWIMSNVWGRFFLCFGGQTIIF